MTPDGALARLVGLTPGRLPALVADLTRAGVTIACAESLTGGLLCALLTEVPGSSAVLRGGLVVYATELKHDLAGVDADLLAARGPVDPEVAIQLAHGARTVCGAAVGIGLTGVAGPDPQGDAAVGTWFVALAGRTGHRLVSSMVTGDAMPASVPAGSPTDSPAPAFGRSSPGREEIRIAAVRAAVDLLADLPALVALA